MSRFVPVLILLSVFFFVSRAKAACVDYFDGGTAFCSAEGGCEGSYPVVLCTLGFIIGTCRNGPNGGLCCGTPFDVAQINPGGDTCDGPIGIFGRLHHRNRKTLARLKSKPRVTLLNYSAPRMLFIPNRCEQAYDVLFENYVPAISKRN